MLEILFLRRFCHVGFSCEDYTHRPHQIAIAFDIEPLVKLKDSTAVVEIVTFTKWGGFYRVTYTISRNFPHEILDAQEDNIIPHDCGIMF
ncbi:MAG: hypothetical protein HUU12_15830 [Anaerolineales bacterium]|nr:hypothetical protein [Anaerolineales bacterium]NUQ60808.1 hypothetical protein [Anaerolineales bacterium]